MTKNTLRMGSEKRIYQRKKLRTKVIFEDEAGEGFIYFYSTDISAGGLFFESDVPLRIGTRVFLSFALQDSSPPIRVTGQIVRVERDPAGNLPAIGMGIQFVDLPEVASKMIEHYIS